MKEPGSQNPRLSGSEELILDSMSIPLFLDYKA